jgi:hypothetical protein
MLGLGFKSALYRKPIRTQITMRATTNKLSRSNADKIPHRGGDFRAASSRLGPRHAVSPSNPALSVFGALREFDRSCRASLLRLLRLRGPLLSAESVGRLPMRLAWPVLHSLTPGTPRDSAIWLAGGCLYLLWFPLPAVQGIS